VKKDQLSLFGGAASAQTVQPAANERAQELAGDRPQGLYLGTSSWSFPGWQGLVWAREHDEKTLAREGLAAYAAHPLLNAVGVDRTHYAPIDDAAFRVYADAVPEDFRFLVKAHEDLTLHTFPKHARYGARRGAVNTYFLDAGYAIDVVVGPTVEGLQHKLGALLFQFAPQDVRRLGGPARFAERLHAFLSALPEGAPYAVEVRNPQLLTPAYRDALLDVGASHCLNAISGMPSLREQVQRVQKAVGPRLVMRWMLRRGYSYEEAYERYAPFGRVVDDDPETRREAADILVHALATGRQAMVIANNKAEGCAPLTLERLLEEVVGR
jgi:uncharacterized protein YecE (DUF72 family)